MSSAWSLALVALVSTAGPVAENVEPPGRLEVVPSAPETPQPPEAPATPPAAAAEQEGPIVVGVEVHLPPGMDPTGLPQKVVVVRNQPLSMKAVRRSIDLLYRTERVADVVVRTIPERNGVRVVFELAPKKQFTQLAVQGERVLTEDAILDATGLDRTGEYYPELLEQMQEQVRAAYWRRGYRQARVGLEIHELEKGSELLLMIQEGPPTHIEGVSVGGNPGLPISRLVEALGLPPGAVLDLDALEQGIERLKAVYREQRFFRARVGDPEVLPGRKGGAMIAVPVVAGPRYDFHFHGNRSFPDKLLEGILSYDGTETLDDAVMTRMARRVASFYRYRGFRDVRVRPREVRTPNHTHAVIAFDVTEGHPLYVKSVTFEGNQAIDDLALRRILRDQLDAMAPLPRADVPQFDDPLESEGRVTGGERPPSPNPDPLTVFVAEAYAEAARAMREAYREKGYLSAKVVVPEVDIDVAGREARARIQITEGPQAVVREVKYLGLPNAFDPSSAAQLRAGQPFRYSGMDETSRQLTRALGRAGYLFARVEPEHTVSTDGRAAIAGFRIEAGPQVHVGKVVVRGLNRADEDMVRANLVVREGQVMDPEALFDSQRNLVLLGIFRNVAVRLIEPDVVADVKDVIVDVRERPRISGEVSGGYSLVDGPRLVGDLAYPNFGGLGTSLTARAKLNYVGASAQVLSGQLDADELQGLDGLDGRVNLALVQPRIYAILPVQLGLRADAIAERVHRPSFMFQRVAGVLGADWMAQDWLTLSVQYEAEYDQVRLRSRVLSLARLEDPALQRYRFQSGNFSLHSLRPSLTLDFRDDYVRPTRGVLISGSSEVTQDLGAALLILGRDQSEQFPIYTLKLAGTITGYVPLASRVVLALSGRGGKIFHLHPESRSIPPKRFFMGGSSSMRGFREDGVIAQDRRAELQQDREHCSSIAFEFGCTPETQLLNAGGEVPSEGGEIFTLAKSELRFPIYSAFDLGLFFEAGNLWLDQAQFDPLKLRYVAGTGLRYGTPIGPIAFDVGINLDPDLALNEPRANLHFSIGLF